MTAHVLSELSFRSESHMALRADERLLTSVCPSMGFQVAPFTKRFLTDFALEWLLPSVLAHVDL